MALGGLQLGLLIWKCWKTEARNPGRLAAEILVPLLMFILLAGFRMAFNLKTTQNECHLNARPLPSAGAVPFLQGLVCNYQNECNDNKTLGEDTRYPFGPTLITSMIQNADIMSQKLAASSNDLLLDGSFIRLLKQLVALRDLFLGRNLPPQAARYSTITGIWSLLCDKPFTLFNKSSSASPFGFGGGGGSGSSSVTEQKVYTDECSAFLSQFQYIKPLWSAVANIFVGKILYYPDSLIVRNLMQRVDKTLDWKAVFTTAIIRSMKNLNDARQNYNSATNLQNQLVNGGMISNSDALWVATFLASPEFDDLLQTQLPTFIRKMQCFRILTDATPKVYQYNSTMSPLVSSAATTSSNGLGIRFEGYNDSTAMVAQAMMYAKNNGTSPTDPPLLGAVQFDDTMMAASTLPNLIRYSLRIDPSNLDKTNVYKAKSYDGKVRRNPAQSEMPYFTTGFIYLQDAVEKAIIAIQSQYASGGLAPSVYSAVGNIMQQFPFPCYMIDQFMSNLSSQMLLFIVLGWLFPAAMIVKTVVYEKECKLREVARIMGISPGLHFLSWFIFWFTVLLISVILLVLLVRGSSIIVYSNPGMVLLIMIVYACSVISFSFFISSFFSRANVGSVVGGLAYFMTWIAQGGIQNGNADGLNFRLMMASSLLPNVALGYGWNIIGRLELAQEGSKGDNFNKPLTDEPEDQYTLFHCFIMLVVDTLLYYFIAWYVEYVYPGEYGVAQPFYFIFLPSFWCGDCCQKNSRPTSSSSNGKAQNGIKPKAGDGKSFEDEPTHLKVGCSLDSIVKFYDFGVIDMLKMKCGKKSSHRRAAVDNLSLNMYDGQITALLGHNGAGKTTTMSIMTGLIAATSGHVAIGGHDVASELEQVRKVLGFCPQFNVLYDNLSVEEHLWFYARIRGIEKSVIKEDIERMLKDTNLTVKRNEPARVLSGGMRRRLSIAIAFIGNSKCVILDEPTAGVDPYARRAIWDLLSKFRAGRTIVLSTHHMDEAEVLADRIAIISQGRLQTCGSPLFLKESFGDGYRLTIIRSGGGKNSGDAGASNGSVSYGPLTDADRKHEARITDFIKQQVGANCCKLVDHVAGEINYQLSYEGVPKFATVLNSLEKSKNELGISNYGLSDSTMEEIFIKMADMADADEQQGHENAALEHDDGNNKQNSHAVAVHMNDASTTATMPEYQALTGPALTSAQFWALQVKRFHRMRRNWKGFISELILPIVFVLFGVIIIKAAEYKPGNAPILELQPWLMAPTSKTNLDQRLYTFYSSSSYYASLAATSSISGNGANDSLTAAMVRSDYAGTRCMDPGTYTISNFPCKFDSGDSDWTTSDKFRQRTCSCNADGVQKCSATSSADVRNAGLPNNGNPFYRVMRTTDNFLNLTQFDVSTYIIDQYQSIRQNLYGGFSYMLQPAQEIMSYPYPKLAPSDFTTSGLVAPSALMVWFNNKGYLSSVAYNNYVNNMLLRMAVSPNLNAPQTSFGIIAFNQPLNYTKDQFTQELTRSVLIDVMLAIMLILALSFVPASFVMFLIEDRISDSKHVQIVSGLRPFIYWLGNYFWDCVNFLIPAIVCLIIFAIFQLQAYVNEKTAGALLLLFILYGFAVAPMLYPTSLFFDAPSTAFVLLACANLFLGAATTVATWFLDLFATTDPSISSLNDILKTVFFIFPQYCLGRGLINIATAYRQAQGTAYFTGKSNFLDQVKPFDWDICGKYYFALILHLCGWLLVVIFIEYRMSIFRCCITCRNSCNSDSLKKRRGSVGDTPPNSPKSRPALDPDVAAERNAVLAAADDGTASDGSKYAMMVRNLSKVFQMRRGKRLVAVNKLTFGVSEGQCFGLLGVNGAGKSTTFNMLTGRLLPTSGSATIHGFDILGARNEANKMIGYCPQYDCITPLLSGRENLEFFARLRGVPEKNVKQVAFCNYTRMDLTPHALKPAGAYSGGNKRKLSAAIAMTGEPALIFLDEPTAGVDPRARRFLWRSISNLLLNGQSVVLTTHSMDECEALCTRLGIMVSGEFRCLGSPQHLKARFGEGYVVNLRFQNQPGDAMKDSFNAALRALTERFSDVRLKEAHDNVAVYSLGASGREPVRIGDLFGFLTNTSTTSSLKITEYSVMQSSLDAVFVTFAKMQSDDPADQQPLQQQADDVSDIAIVDNNNNNSKSAAVRKNNKEVVATSAL